MEWKRLEVQYKDHCVNVLHFIKGKSIDWKGEKVERKGIKYYCIFEWTYFGDN